MTAEAYADPRAGNTWNARAPALADQPGAGHPFGSELDLQDVAGPAHAADRGAKEVGVGFPRHVDDGIVGQTQAQRRDVPPEGARHVVILAVAVRGHHADQRDVLGSRHHGREEASVEQHAIDVDQRRARLGAQDPGRAIEPQDAVGERRPDHRRLSPAGQRRVAVGTTEPAHQPRAARHRREVFTEDLPSRSAHAAPTRDPRFSSHRVSAPHPVGPRRAP